MAGTELNPTRYPSAAMASAGYMNYAELFKTYRELEGDVDLSHLALGMAAGELAIAITPVEPGAEPASTLHSRLPQGELAPERIFDFLSEAERQNLQRASTIVDLIRASFTFSLNEQRWAERG